MFLIVQDLVSCALEQVAKGILLHGIAWYCVAPTKKVDTLRKAAKKGDKKRLRVQKG